MSEGQVQQSRPREYAAKQSSTPHGLPIGWMRLVPVAAFLTLLLQNGFALPSKVDVWLDGLEFGLVAIYAIDLVLAFRNSRDRRQALLIRRFEFVALVLFTVLIVAVSILTPEARERIFLGRHIPSNEVVGLTLMKLLLLFFVGVQASRAALRLFVMGVRPQMVLAASFGILIMMGTLLLLLPRSSATPLHHVSAVDALFTATSASCVTGLVVRDTGTDFSRFGQVIILSLMQIGGLGIISFVAFLSVFSTRALPVPQMVVFRSVVNAPAHSDLKRQFTGLLLITFVIELAGAALLLKFYPGQGDILERLYWCVFHAISAFCNAGFALQPDSLVPYAANTGLVLTISGLIILGGLGFLVIPELITLRRTRGKWFQLNRSPHFRRLTLFRHWRGDALTPRLSLQARLALTITAILLVAGFAGFWLLERNHLLAGGTAGQGLLSALFQSVTARTAGFNTVAIEQLQPATLVLVLILMVIGANPVSTGGGIKTVTFGILLLALRAMITQRDRVEAFGRTIPTRTLFAALSIFGIYVICAATGVFLLTLTDPQFTLQQLIFEVISALSTVGLSTGITAELSAPGKLVLCVAMFIGRVGPISLVLSVFHSPGQLLYEYPEEEVVVS